MKNIITALEQGKRDYKAELDRINTNYVKGSYEYNKAQIKAADDYKAYKLSQVDVFKKELIRAQAQADVLKEMYEKYTGPTDEEIAKGDRAINLIATVGNKLSSDLLTELLEDVKDMQQRQMVNQQIMIFTKRQQSSVMQRNWKHQLMNRKTILSYWGS